MLSTNALQQTGKFIAEDFWHRRKRIRNENLKTIYQREIFRRF